ncbi:MAG: hypothetical protein HZA25_02535 [Candidatus Niyogibacteria bacterium]|nr:hypothetical protein [Candidatus Niyogibacteria bacterium]
MSLVEAVFLNTMLGLQHKTVILIVVILLLIGGAALVVLSGNTGLEGLGDYKALFPMTKKQVPVPDIANAGSLAARRDLAQQIGVPEDMIVIMESRHVAWPDGCLGLAERDETCTQAIVSGYAIMLREGGRDYHYRTSKDGLIVRMEKN